MDILDFHVGIVPEFFKSFLDDIKVKIVWPLEFLRGPGQTVRGNRIGHNGNCSLCVKSIGSVG